MDYNFPSLSKCGKLPQIVVEGDIADYTGWFSSSGIAPIIPPLYQDFCIQYRHEEYRYMDIVHYSDDLTEFLACHCLNGKKILHAGMLYSEQQAPGLINGYGEHPVESPYREDWIKRESIACLTAVLAVQAYILFHRPELVPAELPAPKRKTTGKPSSDKRQTKVSSTKRHIIRLEPVEKIPVLKNYRAIQWQVRGHYRRYKSGKMVYIAPHTAKRGNKKLAPANIIIEPDNRQKGEQNES